MNDGERGAVVVLLILARGLLLFDIILNPLGVLVHYVIFWEPRQPEEEEEEQRPQMTQWAQEKPFINNEPAEGTCGV